MMNVFTQNDHIFPPGLGHGIAPQIGRAVDEVVDDDICTTTSTAAWKGDVLELDSAHPKFTIDGDTIVEHVIKQKDGPFKKAFDLAGVKRSDDTIEEVRRGVAVTHSHIASVARKGTMRAVDLDSSSEREPHRFEVLSNSRRVYDLEACEGRDGSSYVVCTDGMYDVAVSRFSPCTGARRDAGIAGCELYIHLEGEERSEVAEVHWCPMVVEGMSDNDDGVDIDHVFFTVHADGSLCFWSLRHVRAIVAAGSHPVASNCPQGFSRVSIEVRKCEDVCLHVYRQAAAHYKETDSVDDGSGRELDTSATAEGRVAASISTDGSRLATACGSHVRYFTVNPSSWEVHIIAEHDIASGEEVRGIKSAIIGCTETIFIILEKALVIALQFKGEIQIGQVIRLTSASSVSFVGSVDAVTLEAVVPEAASVDTEELTVEAPSETLTIALLTQATLCKSYWMLLSAGSITFYEVEGVGIASGFVAHSNPNPSAYTMVTWSVGDPGQPKYQYLYSNGAVLELDRIATVLKEAAEKRTGDGVEDIESEKKLITETVEEKSEPPRSGGMKASDLIKQMQKIRSAQQAAKLSDAATTAALEVSGAPLPGEISSGEEVEEGAARTISEEESVAAADDHDSAMAQSPAGKGSSNARRTGPASESVGSSLSPRKGVIASTAAAAVVGEQEKEPLSEKFVPSSDPLTARQVRKFIRFLADSVQVACQKTVEAASSEEPVEVDGSLSTEVGKLSRCLAEDMTPEALTGHMMVSDKVWRGVRRLSSSVDGAGEEVTSEVARTLPGIVKELFVEKAVPAVVEALEDKVTEINTFEQPDSSANEGALGSLADDIVRVDEEVRGLGVSLGQMEAILRRTEHQAAESMGNQQESVLGIVEIIEALKASGIGRRSGSASESIDASQIAASVAMGLQDDIEELNEQASELRADVDRLHTRAGEAPPSSSYLQADPRPDWQRVKEYLRSQQYHWAVATALEIRENTSSILPPMRPERLQDDLVGFACFEVDKLASVDSFVRSVAGVDSPSRTWPQEKCDRLNLALMQMLRLVDYLVWASATFTASEDLGSLESVVRVIGLDANAVEELCRAGAAQRPDMVNQSLSRVVTRLRAVKFRSSGMRLAVTELRSHLLSIQNDGVFRRSQPLAAPMPSWNNPGNAESPLMSGSLRSSLG
ncbi:hypothetical protein Pmar_PMAR001084 [Perkinsus marinus ATCC 50983]|uniref:Uncharacterized protein n=1 Tax=Perkinsus marinus (strain ATCC 50983 / TXsc) TaxID=423536 RepID=C5KST7_PERM5|nr:hypothetical protein Pmar_PMAR001084 [Perkinsus marinus ATCC 50983]EER12287.1 hypothetical protein Pmar_PMAR001084 [Perkinsus marinus ATCC 50983]|eukprot:XP_002780492.1 hypothetical protein Pmar_PMAR001084 [Perkinsus marinus ATCC 50983]